MKQLFSGLVALSMIPCGCLVLQDRPRTDECVVASVDLSSTSDELDEELDVPEELEFFTCLDSIGEPMEVPSMVIDLRYGYGFDRNFVRAVDDRGRVLQSSLLDPSCDQTPPCSNSADEELYLGGGLDNRNFLVVQPLPSSRTIRLEAVSSICPTSYDGVCDEPDRCAPGTDEFDCE